MFARRQIPSHDLGDQVILRRVRGGQDQRGAHFVARQRIGRLAVDRHVQPGAEIGPPHPQRGVSAPKSEARRIAGLADVGAEFRSKAPATGIGLRRILRLGEMEAGKGHAGGHGAVSQGGGQRRSGNAKTPARIRRGP